MENYDGSKRSITFDMHTRISKDILTSIKGYLVFNSHAAIKISGQTPTYIFRQQTSMS